jgi:uncharacterized protein (DUF58 family)
VEIKDIVMLALVVLAAFYSYKSGYSSGAKDGFQDGIEEVSEAATTIVLAALKSNNVIDIIILDDKEVIVPGSGSMEK